MQTIGNMPITEFVEQARQFHGSAAPGILIGAFMVQAARARLPRECLFDALSETPKCLPDAIQLLTPCTIGNGWMKIINLGRFALSLYDKFTGIGVRVYIDRQRVQCWSEIDQWYFKRITKKNQNKDKLMAQIRAAGDSICGIHSICVAPEIRTHAKRGQMAACPTCREGYPANDGAVCRACQGQNPFVSQHIADNDGKTDLPIVQIAR